MSMFSDGVKISEIARRVGVSRQSVYRVIDADVERDPEIKKLEKDLKKAELMMKIREVRKPIKRESELDGIRYAIDNLFSKLLVLMHVSSEVKGERRFCVYCDNEMEYFEEKKPPEGILTGYRCHHCNKVFPLT